MLYIVPTPIGNLKDITLRALETLKECDFVLCEDTRKTGALLHHFEISKKLISFHKHNEKSKEERVLEELEAGKNVALVSDAGTPSINDPGVELIRACHERNIKVSSLPGASSVTCALALSGLKCEKFQFLGFFPRKDSERKKWIEEMLVFDGVSIFFESPNRILKSISLFPVNQAVYVAKEISKIHEALLSVTSETAKDFEDVLTRGEMCVLVKGSKAVENPLSFEDSFLMETLNKYVSNKDAVKIAAELTGKKKQHFYSI